MGKASSRLEKILKYLEISNITLARAIVVDASLVSRWVSGQRHLRLSSRSLNKLSDYLMDRIIYTHNTDWLRQQIEADGVILSCVSSSDLHNALKMWLSSDGDDVSKTLDILQASEYVKTVTVSRSAENLKIGHTDITDYLSEKLESLPDNSRLDIQISNEGSGLLLNDPMYKMLLGTILTKRLQVRLIISLTGSTAAISRLLSHYMQAVIEGLVSMSIVHSMTQSIMNQSIFIIGDELVFIVCETQRSVAAPIGTVVKEECFIRETKYGFDRVHTSSHPLLQSYNDDYSKKVLGFIFQEYAMPGNLDVIKDNINPIFMSTEEYALALKSFGNKGAQLKWRNAEFGKFKTGIDENLKNGVIFREILSLNRLRQVATDGVCKMPALYFMNAGIAYLGASGCLSIIEGYIRYLKKAPSFQVLILDDMTSLNEHSCWHLKQNLSVTLNGWNKDEHVILYSNQLILTHEFQMFFNDLWNKENYSEGFRKKMIRILQEIAEQLKTNHNL